MLFGVIWLFASVRPGFCSVSLVSVQFAAFTDFNEIKRERSRPPTPTATSQSGPVFPRGIDFVGWRGGDGIFVDISFNFFKQS